VRTAVGGPSGPSGPLIHAGMTFDGRGAAFIAGFGIELP
jgi:hypothetical protein